MQPRSIEITHTAGRINLDAGRDALGAAKRCIAGAAWTIDELRAAAGSDRRCLISFRDGFRPAQRMRVTIKHDSLGSLTRPRVVRGTGTGDRSRGPRYHGESHVRLATRTRRMSGFTRTLVRVRPGGNPGAHIL